MRYFPGRDEAWLLAQRDRLTEDSAEGTVLISGAAGDSSHSSAVETSIDERLRRIAHDLYTLDPVTYPASDYVQDRATKARFA